MGDYDALVKRYSGNYQSRLEYLDKLLAEADRHKGSGPEAEAADEELATLRREREELLKDAEQLKKKTREEWQEETLEETGPMIMWEAVAKKLEGLIERIGRIRR
jgi:F0F1-type ATP synthase membrane subunit b/b'